MKSKQSLHNSTSGFSVLELLAASTMGLLMTALAISTVIANRNAYQHDLVRTRLNQNVRGAMDIIGVNIREAGENLPDSVPVVELINGASGAPDQLILRRNLIDEVLKLCTAITAGSGDKRVFFAEPSGSAGCNYSEQTTNYNAWKGERTSRSGTVYAYIFDPTTGLGEVFDYVTEVDDSTAYYIERGSGTWSNDYTVGLTAVYIIEQWHFQLTDDPLDIPSNRDLLTLIENGVTGDPQPIVYGISDLQFTIDMKSGPSKTDFGIGDNWTEIEAINVTLRGEDDSKRGLISRELSSKYFPRNILSN